MIDQQIGPLTIVDALRSMADISIVIDTETFIGGAVMRQARKRRWTTWLQRVEFCDACGQVCTRSCRSAAARAAAVDGRLAAGLSR